MTTIYLIRHAEAEGNLYRRIQGHYDGQITIHGEKQIDALAERFKDIRIDALYSSDLTRTRRTAGAILKYHPELKLRITPRLREVCMGVWEDQPWGNVEWAEPEQMGYFSNDPARWHVQGGEDFICLGQRIRDILCELAARHDGQTIAAVSHGMAIRTLVAAARGIPSERVGEIPHGDNTAVTLLHVSGRDIQVEYFNDNSHLPKEISTFAQQTWWKGGSGPDKSNLRLLPMDPRQESELYLRCYRQAWEASHGSAVGFQPQIYLDSAIVHVQANPLALMKALQGDRFVGLVELNTTRDASLGVGWISLCCLEPASCHCGLGVQLLGHAISVYRKLGRKVLRLHVSETNENAIRFYTHYGFRQIGEDEGVCGTLLLMERPV